MLFNQGCLLIYTSVGNTWISLLSMLHNCFTESFCLFFTMYLVFMWPCQKESDGGKALSASGTGPAERQGCFSPSSPHGTVLLDSKWIPFIWTNQLGEKNASLSADSLFNQYISNCTEKKIKSKTDLVQILVLPAFMWKSRVKRK